MVFLTFYGNGTFRGFGTDDIGDFQFVNGRITASQEITFEKRYSTHDVSYQGTLVGSHINGMWNISTFCRGQFDMWPAI